MDKVAELSEMRFGVEIETIGISSTQGLILDFILVESQKRSVYQKDIEEEFDLRPSTATETLKLMEKKQLIRREPEEKDGRYKRIVFTEKAEGIRMQLKEEIETSESILLSGISREEQEQFLKIAKKMLENLEKAEGRDSNG